MEQLQNLLLDLEKCLQCAICLESMKNPITTRCDHNFCSNCIRKALKGKAEIPCPLCLATIRQRSLKKAIHLMLLVNGMHEASAKVREQTGTPHGNREEVDSWDETDPITAVHEPGISWHEIASASESCSLFMVSADVHQPPAKVLKTNGVDQSVRPSARTFRSAVSCRTFSGNGATTHPLCEDNMLEVGLGNDVMATDFEVTKNGAAICLSDGNISPAGISEEDPYVFPLSQASPLKMRKREPRARTSSSKKLCMRTAKRNSPHIQRNAKFEGNKEQLHGTVLNGTERMPAEETSHKPHANSGSSAKLDLKAHDTEKPLQEIAGKEDTGKRDAATNARKSVGESPQLPRRLLSSSSSSTSTNPFTDKGQFQHVLLEEDSSPQSINDKVSKWLQNTGGNVPNVNGNPTSPKSFIVSEDDSISHSAMSTGPPMQRTIFLKRRKVISPVKLDPQIQESVRNQLWSREVAVFGHSRVKRTFGSRVRFCGRKTYVNIHQINGAAGLNNTRHNGNDLVHHIASNEQVNDNRLVHGQMESGMDTLVDKHVLFENVTPPSYLLDTNKKAPSEECGVHETGKRLPQANGSPNHDDLKGQTAGDKHENACMIVESKVNGTVMEERESLKLVPRQSTVFPSSDLVEESDNQAIDALESEFDMLSANQQKSLLSSSLPALGESPSIEKPRNLLLKENHAMSHEEMKCPDGGGIGQTANLSNPCDPLSNCDVLASLRDMEDEFSNGYLQQKSSIAYIKSPSPVSISPIPTPHTTVHWKKHQINVGLCHFSKVETNRLSEAKIPFVSAISKLPAPFVTHKSVQTEHVPSISPSDNSFVEEKELGDNILHKEKEAESASNLLTERKADFSSGSTVAVDDGDKNTRLLPGMKNRAPILPGVRKLSPEIDATKPTNRLLVTVKSNSTSKAANRPLDNQGTVLSSTWPGMVDADHGSGSFSLCSLKENDLPKHLTDVSVHVERLESFQPYTVTVTTSKGQQRCGRVCGEGNGRFAWKRNGSIYANGDVDEMPSSPLLFETQRGQKSKGETQQSALTVEPGQGRGLTIDLRNQIEVLSDRTEHHRYAIPTKDDNDPLHGEIDDVICCSWEDDRKKNDSCHEDQSSINSDRTGDLNDDVQSVGSGLHGTKVENHKTFGSCMESLMKILKELANLGKKSLMTQHPEYSHSIAKFFELGADLERSFATSVSASVENLCNRTPASVPSDSNKVEQFSEACEVQFSDVSAEITSCESVCIQNSKMSSDTRGVDCVKQKYNGTIDKLENLSTLEQAEDSCCDTEKLCPEERPVPRFHPHMKNDVNHIHSTYQIAEDPPWSSHSPATSQAAQSRGQLSPKHAINDDRLECADAGDQIPVCENSIATEIDWDVVLEESVAVQKSSTIIDDQEDCVGTEVDLLLKGLSYSNEQADIHKQKIKNVHSWLSANNSPLVNGSGFTSSKKRGANSSGLAPVKYKTNENEADRFEQGREDCGLESSMKVMDYCPALPTTSEWLLNSGRHQPVECLSVDTFGVVKSRHSFEIVPHCGNVERVSVSPSDVSWEKAAASVPQVTDNHLRQLIEKPKMGLVTSGLQEREVRFVKAFARKYHGEFFATFHQDKVTHVIVKTSTRLSCDRTLKYLQGIACKKWVVSLNWIVESLTCRTKLPEHDFEVVGDNCMKEFEVRECVIPEGPRRSRMSEPVCKHLSGFRCVCLPPFGLISIGQASDLLEMCGATAVGNLGSLLATDHDASGREETRLIIIDTETSSDRSLDYLALGQQFKATVVTIEWIYESISRYEAQPLDDFVVTGVTQEVHSPFRD